MIVIAVPVSRDGFFCIQEKLHLPKKKMEMIIREAALHDVPAVNRLTIQLGYPLTLNETRFNLERVLSNDNEVVYLSVHNEEPIGWIHVFHAVRLESGSFCELGGLVVDERFRGQKIGNRLIEEAIKWTRNRKVPVLKLRSNVIRKVAHRFYERLGFIEKKEQKLFELHL
jgi:GNAT superfamily N-acetyltransferase